MGWPQLGPDTRVRRGRGIEWSLVEEKAVLVNVEDGIVLKLDEVGTAVWKALQEEATVASLVSSVCDAYDVDSKTAGKDVLRLLKYLKKSEAIQLCD